jgi:hypothetical protein
VAVDSLVSNYAVFTVIGLVLVALGIFALLIPIMLKSDVLQWLSRIHPILLYVYRREGFFFVTSPILIAVSLLFLLYRWIGGS